MADGNAFKAEAERALGRTTIFGFGKLKKFEDAAEAFTKAGNCFKRASDWLSAGEMFNRASECQFQADSSTDAINSLVESANCYKRVSPTDAIRQFTSAIDHYVTNGRFGVAAKYQKEIAEIYEADNNGELAIAHYREAAKMFSDDNKKQSASPCLLKIATLASADSKYTEAAEIYETIGRESLETRLGSYSAKGHFLNCLLCHLAAGDTVASAAKVETFKNADYTFASSRECGFLEKLLEATENHNDEDFATVCAEFDRITPLDPWKTSMLLKAKSHIASTGEDGEDNIC